MSDGGIRYSASGVVEAFDQSGARGWVEVQSDDPPSRVDLAVDGIVVDSTWESESALRAGGSLPRPFEFSLVDLWHYLRRGQRYCRRKFLRRNMECTSGAVRPSARFRDQTHFGKCI